MKIVSFRHVKNKPYLTANVWAFIFVLDMDTNIDILEDRNMWRGGEVIAQKNTCKIKYIRKLKPNAHQLERNNRANV
jgi:hypothetical protein